LNVMGLQVRTRPDGMARELVAVDADVCELFSERRRVISAALRPAVAEAEERLGRGLTDQELSRLRQDITLKTRQGKTHDGESLDQRLSRWHAEMTVDTGRGLDPIARRVIAEVAARSADRGGAAHAPGSVTNPDAEALGWSPSAVVEEAVAAVAESRPTWGRGDLFAEISRRIPTLEDVQPGRVEDLVDRLTDTALAGDGVLRVTQLNERPTPEGLQAWAGRPTDVRYAAAGTLAAEDALRRAAVVRGRHHIDPAAVVAWLDANTPDIGADQRAAVVGLAGSDAAVAVLVGPAGTGKSFTAGALAGVWGELSGGGRVVGLATSQNAAEVLAADGLPVTANLTAFRLAQHRLTDGRGLPVDERLGPDGLATDGGIA
jgi:hypothetical protein